MGGCQAREATRVNRVIRKEDFRIPLKVDDPKNLESYCLFWLESTVRSPEFMETHNELRSIVNYLKTSETNAQCLEEFNRITEGKIFLIVNGVQSLTLLPMVHNHKQLHSIYIYHHGENSDMKAISTEYKKIRGIYDSFVTAKRYLEDDIEIHRELDDPVVMDIFGEMNDLDYQEKFNLFFKIVNVKANDIYDRQTRDHLIDICEDYYNGNEKELNFLEEFSQSYKSEQAISWYLRESCLHRLLSHAFIHHDMNLLVDMYSFITDIHQNLKQQCTKQTSSLRVFRSQFLSNEKFNILKGNVNQIITMQCFFSAQTSRDKTVQLLQSIEPNEITDKRIVFEIDVLQDYTIVDSSQASTSKTVLFMLGARFQIVEVTETTVLLSQYTSNLNGNDELANESALVIRGILKYLKEGTREAIKYFEDLLRKQSSMDLATHSSIYGQLGYLKQKSGNLAAATKMYEQAMNYGTMQFGLYLFYLEQAAQYHAKTLGDWEKASILWLQKLSIQKTFLPNEETAETYENLACAALKTKQPAKVVEYILAALANLPNDHPHLPLLHQQLESAQKDSSTAIPIDTETP